MKSYLLLASALLAEQSSVLGLAPLNAPIRTASQSPTSTRLQYITDSNVDLEAMTANTTLASIWKSVVAVPPKAAAAAATPKRTPTLAATRSDIRQTTKPLDTLHVGDRISGVVVRLLPYGALVQTAYDIPGKTPGCVLLHQDQMPSGAPPLALGQEVSSARVVSMNRAKGTVTVSMMLVRDDDQQSRMPLGALQAGDEVPGRVTRIMDYGAFVDVGSRRDALLHKSQISTDCFVASVWDHLQPDQLVTVRVIPSVGAGTGLAVTMLTPDQEAAVRQRSQQQQQQPPPASEASRTQLLHDIDEALRLSLTATTA